MKHAQLRLELETSRSSDKSHLIIGLVEKDVDRVLTRDVAPASDGASNVHDELLERIRLLECSVDSIQRTTATVERCEIGSMQRWRFAVVVLLHGVIASCFTLLSTVLPIVFVNGWVFGSFLLAIIWFEASPRAIADRVSRLFISTLLIIWMLYEATVASYGMFPGVVIFAVFVAPFVMLAARWIMACFRTSPNAPDIMHRRMRPLSILDFGTAVTLAALLLACLRTQEPGAIVKPLVVIVFTVVPALVLCLMVIGLAATEIWPVQILIVGLTIAFLSMATWVTLALFGTSIEDLSWVEIDGINSFAKSMTEPDHPPELSTAISFAVSLVMPCIGTLAMLHFQGYRLLSKRKGSCDSFACKS